MPENVRLDDFITITNEQSNNLRKIFFNRENQEVIKVLKKLKYIKNSMEIKSLIRRI